MTFNERRMGVCSAHTEWPCASPILHLALRVLDLALLRIAATCINSEHRPMARSENLRQGTELALVVSTALPGLRCAIAEGRCDLMPSTPGQVSCFVVEGFRSS